MLKTNSKLTKERIRSFILDSYVPEYFNREEVPDFKTVATDILKEVERVERIPNKCYIAQVAFRSWAQGLPSGFDTSYYLHKAVDTLGDILEQTEQERAKYTEMQAERTLDLLIFRELEKALEK